MSPEVFFRKRQTKKTDIWALGILLYELFHGYAPFKGTRMDSVIKKILKNTISFKKSLRTDIKKLVIRILAFKPHQRPSIDEILSNPIFRCFSAQPPRTPLKSTKRGLLRQKSSLESNSIAEYQEKLTLKT